MSVAERSPSSPQMLALAAALVAPAAGQAMMALALASRAALAGMLYSSMMGTPSFMGGGKGK